jgi:hypothetical protein
LRGEVLASTRMHEKRKPTLSLSKNLSSVDGMETTTKAGGRRFMTIRETKRSKISMGYIYNIIYIYI